MALQKDVQTMVEFYGRWEPNERSESFQTSHPNKLNCSVIHSSDSVFLLSTSTSAPSPSCIRLSYSFLAELEPKAEDRPAQAYVKQATTNDCDFTKQHTRWLL